MAATEAWDRMNTHETTSVTVELFGQTINLAQDPNTEHLGTTVWDASIVLAQALAKNVRKGEFSRAKLAGKRAIELGAGMGLGAIALAMMDVQVVATDTKDVLPLLRLNCERNVGRGKIHVCELDWMVPEQVAPLQPPFDFVIAADCIYHEHIVPHFHRTVMDLTNHKSTVLVVNELRSHSVHAAFMEAFTPTHTIKKMPASKLDDKYQHPLIQVFICKLKRPGKAGKSKDEDGSDVEDDVQPDDSNSSTNTNRGVAASGVSLEQETDGSGANEAAQALGKLTMSPAQDGDT